MKVVLAFRKGTCPYCPFSDNTFFINFSYTCQKHYVSFAIIMMINACQVKIMLCLMLKKKIGITFLMY